MSPADAAVEIQRHLSGAVAQLDGIRPSSSIEHAVLAIAEAAELLGAARALSEAIDLEGRKATVHAAIDAVATTYQRKLETIVIALEGLR